MYDTSYYYISLSNEKKFKQKKKERQRENFYYNTSQYLLQKIKEIKRRMGIQFHVIKSYKHAKLCS